MALNLLCEYSSSESSSEDEGDISSKRPRLPLPSSLKPEVSNEVVDDPLLHNGRKRRYPHERGNWSSLIYVPYKKQESFDIFCEQIISELSSDLELLEVAEPHISLSKTFVLYYHWINEFYSTLKKHLSLLIRFEISFEGLQVYCNEDFSRTFLALTVGNGSKDLIRSVELIDGCLSEYKLPKYYEEPSFHLSFAWCLGDQRKSIEEKMPSLLRILDTFKESSDFSFTVEYYIFKTGFKEYRINLL